MNNSKYYFLKSLSLSEATTKHLLIDSVSPTIHYNNISFWMTCDLSNTITRADVIKAHNNYTCVVSGKTNKKALESALDKMSYNKTLEEEKKRNWVKSKNVFKPRKKVLSTRIYNTGLFHNTLFNTSELEYRIIDNVNKELNNDSARFQYITFWKDVDLNKVYKRATLSAIISKANKARTKKALESVSASNDNAFYTIKDIEKVVSQTDTTTYCDNTALNYILQSKLAERIVYCVLQKNFTRSGDDNYRRLLLGENLPISKEDLIQCLLLHFTEKCFSGEYYIEENKLVFDVVECFRVVNNYMYANSANRGNYKRVSLEASMEEGLDFDYIDKGIENINNNFWLSLSGFISGHGGNNKTYHIIQDIITALIYGYKKKVIASSLSITESNLSHYIKKYIVPFIAYHVKLHAIGDNDKLTKSVRL